jgi:hypothetical protein
MGTGRSVLAALDFNSSRSVVARVTADPLQGYAMQRKDAGVAESVRPALSDGIGNDLHTKIELPETVADLGSRSLVWISNEIGV